MQKTEIGYQVIEEKAIEEDKGVAALSDCAQRAEGFVWEEKPSISREARKSTTEEITKARDYSEGLLKAMPEGICVIDPQGKVVDANDALLLMAGSRREDIVGLPFKQVLISHADPSELGKIAASMRQLAIGAPLKIQELTLRTNDGNRITVLVSLSVVKNDGGEPALFVALLRDITERKKAEEKLAESEKLYSTMANSSPIGIHIVQDGKFIMVNPQLCEMTGYTRDELLGMESLNLVHPDDRELVRENAIKMLKGQSSLAYEYRSIRKNGEIRVVLETVASIQHGSERAFLGNYVDITVRKEAENKVFQANSQLEAAMQQLEASQAQLIQAAKLAAVGELVAGVAHEINNPLTAIYAMSQLLVEEARDEDSREDFLIIQKQTQRVIEIVRNLLSFARKYESKKMPLCVNQAIESKIKLRAHDLAMGNIKVICLFDPDLPGTMADNNRLQQVFLNLINNAYDAMREAHKKGVLTIGTEKVDGLIRITFSDDGPGIPSEIVDRLFEPFFTTKDVGKGTGLGLSVCYGIIREHGGEIRAESVLGKGATFTVDLPIVADSSGGLPELERVGRRK
ncbi:MAG: PAS domain S-box protein [Dehalococcoidia bacterium]|nr:PAS domain S-box protein [Dehalococcoidia bacterium]